LGRAFLKTQIKMVNDLKFQSFDINPLLAKALSLDTPQKIIAFNVYQTITRSIVTSWGFTVEQITKFVGGSKNDFNIEGKTGTNFDVKKKLSGMDYYIQIKSGPNDMNIGMITSLNEAIIELEKSQPNSIGILGMTYGTRSRISGQILSHFDDAANKMKIGRELWDFISETENFHTKLFHLLDISSRDLLNNSFTELIEFKIKEFEEYWKETYSDLSINEVLDKYI
jgi:hypothetical protein